MYEKEWFSCSDPHKMFVYLRPDIMAGFPYKHSWLCNDHKLRLWVEACREEHQRRRPSSLGWAAPLETHLEVAVRTWTDGSDVVPGTVVADLLRDICGNPWRRVALCGRVRKPFHNQFAHVDENGSFWLEAECQACQRILHHNGGTVLHLAREIYGGEEACGRCGGDGTVPNYTGMYRLGSNTCSACRGTGEITRPFNPSLMPMLGDALEDAGCRDVEILNHCRGMRRCPRCAPLNHGESSIGCGDTLHKETGLFCNGGWVRNETPCVRGCWVIDLLLNLS